MAVFHFDLPIVPPHGFVQNFQFFMIPRFFLVMKRYLPLLLLALVPFFLHSSNASTPRSAASQTEGEIEKALFEAIAAYHEDVVAFLIFEVVINRIEFDATGQWAVVWLDLHDPQTGQPVPTEPGLVLAHREGDAWNILLQADPAWRETLEDVPEDLLPEENKAIWLARYTQALSAAPSAPLGGYLLPWAAGLTKTLTRSISHGGTGYYAFDFADGSMFPIYASRGGTVHLVRWDYPNGYDDGNCAHSNYIILEDTTTSPTTYQLYLHLAFESVPENLRTVGAPVVQGQFLGNADDTGCSTGHHLHFHVHTNPYSYWGTAVDITFDDVNINGGRPRTPGEASSPDCLPAPCVGQSTYTSQNTPVEDTLPPTGGLTKPAHGTEIPETAPPPPTSVLELEGWVEDEGSGLKTVYFVAKYGDGDWVQIGPTVTNPQNGAVQSYDWTVCNNQVPEGPVSVAIFAEDKQGNQSGPLDIRTVIKDFPCNPPPPACVPTASQVALFTEPLYQGDCLTLDAGPHLITLSSEGLLGFPLTEGVQFPSGSSKIASVSVGNSAFVTLYRENIFRGRAQTFFTSDPNLSDDWIGTEGIALAEVGADNATPFTPIAAWPVGGVQFPETSTISLVWDDGGGASGFVVKLNLPGGGDLNFTTGSTHVLHLDGETLLPGNYTWQVRGANAGQFSPFSELASFTILSGASTAPSKSVPYSDGFEGANDWIATGQWNLLTNNPSAAHNGNNSWWYGQPPFSSGNYDTGSPHSGGLISPPIQIPGSGGPYYLRFWSWHDTEGGQHWDQRWVQISENGNPFENIYQLTDDPPLTWVQSPFLDLSAYAGDSIRVRFYFATLDDRDNAGKGWLVDDVTINNTAPPNCTDDEPSGISPGQTLSGKICGPGDVDIFSFTGIANDIFAVDVNAASIGSNLDPYLILLASDQASLVAENNDESDSLVDPHLGFQLLQSGEYFLKLRAWDHPGAGSSAHNYTIRLLQDATAPTASGLSPAGSQTDNAFLPADTVVPVTVTASDAGSGVQKVEFWWHSGDWLNDAWILLGVDADGSDGWALPGGWDTAGVPDQLGMALLARVMDWAGNQELLAAWNLALDRVPPQTTLAGMPFLLDTTAIQLQWTSTDNVGPIEAYSVWECQNLPCTDVELESGLPPYVTEHWEIRPPGQQYTFSVRAKDQAGNEEPLQNGINQITVSIQACQPTDEDAWESDDAREQASEYLIAQAHNFCQLNDEDWVKVTLQGKVTYRIQILPLAPSAAAVIELYDKNGNFVRSAQPQGATSAPNDPLPIGLETLGLPTMLIFRPTVTNVFYLRVYHPVSGAIPAGGTDPSWPETVAGAGVWYQLQLLEEQAYLPLIVR